jgi:glycine betaine catabolism B
MSFVQSIISIKQVTHNVKCIRLDKPKGYQFKPGQATEVSINKQGWTEEKRPFTFTSLASDPYLEFTIKCYSDHQGVTNEIGKLSAGDELILRDVWGAIEYKGPGYFIAGGAGITPFIAILRQLHRDTAIEGNKLFFSNVTSRDIIYERELSDILGQDAKFIVTGDEAGNYERDFIDESFLTKNIHDFSRPFYVCGPDKMVADINDILLKLGAKPDLVVFEK